MIYWFLALAQAAAPAPDCSRPQPLPAALSGWTASGDSLASGRALTLPAGQDAGLIALMPAPSRPGGVAAVSFVAPRPGVYGIAVDQGAWVDVYQDRESGSTLLQSVAHGHGPPCSGIRKIVRFRLDGGVHILHLSGMTGPAAKVMLIAEDEAAPQR